MCLLQKCVGFSFVFVLIRYSLNFGCIFCDISIILADCLLPGSLIEAEINRIRTQNPENNWTFEQKLMVKRPKFTNINFCLQFVNFDRKPLNHSKKDIFYEKKMFALFAGFLLWSVIQKIKSLFMKKEKNKHN